MTRQSPSTEQYAYSVEAPAKWLCAYPVSTEIAWEQFRQEK